jgi:hypothetical protein
VFIFFCRTYCERVPAKYHARCLEINASVKSEMSISELAVPPLVKCPDSAGEKVVGIVVSCSSFEHKLARTCASANGC